MVLFKRKAVELARPPPVANENQHVWYIKRTGEYFADYDEYLKRMDFYNQRKFVCEITGHSNLSYFEALDSETSEAHEVDEIFPDSLKEPVLRRVQFSTVSRLDHLVDQIYESFKADFYPGEYVVATLAGDKHDVVIREKAQFNSIQLPNGEIRPPYAKYRIEILSKDRLGHEEIVDEPQISRDRKRFSKSMLRTFIKNAVSRESWAGAPWLVKERYAIRYRIDMNIPSHLLRNKGLTPQEMAEAARRARELNRKRDDKPAGKERLTKAELAARELEKRRLRSTEDLDLIELADPPAVMPRLQIEPAFPRELHGAALETWAFLNLYHEPLLLSAFSFDDFVQALQHDRFDMPCELFAEMHAAVLKVIVGPNLPAQLAVALPEQDAPDSDSDDDRPAATDDEDEFYDANENKNETDDADDTHDEHPDGASDGGVTNRAADMQRWKGGGWKERLQRRLFVNGGMETIIVGVLHEIADVDEYRPACVRILDQVAPLDLPATLETAGTQYYKLPAGDKLAALHMLCRLIRDAPLIRARIDHCMEESTRLRRERLETHKEQRQLADTLKSLEDARLSYFPDGLPSADTTDNEDDDAKPRRRRNDAESALARTDASFRKLIVNINATKKAIQKCADALRQAEADLRGFDCQRARMLGRDRYYNRYWWFENNGLADGAPGTYAMGRLWVQGPTPEDVEQFLGGHALFDTMLVAQRMRLEVDPGSVLRSMDDWGYYDDAASIDRLVAWLGTKGSREPRLKKDFELRRDRLVETVAARRAYLGLEDPKDDVKLEDDERPAKRRRADDDSDDSDEDRPRRRSSRQSAKHAPATAAAPDAIIGDKDYRFLNWHNAAAVAELGHTHYEANQKKKDLFATPAMLADALKSDDESSSSDSEPSPPPPRRGDRAARGRPARGRGRGRRRRRGG
ncbi:ATP-utilizing chromatin assembly and remodelling N-terminal-domain-containing protein [Dipodascopsis tothii]|uniref:ATP-utilizing chromatin assembly and remodelling N-terminal-domain-containing protein n=1 Tax=Dipodascopsis tothii TaxID=44089 RepID=UPI0034CDF322